MTVSGIGITFLFDSHQVSKLVFHFSKLANTKPKKECGDENTQQKAGQIKLTLPAQYAPAKSVDDPDHGVQRIQETPLVRNDAGAVTDRRRIEAELNQEWDDIADVPIFHVQSSKPKAGAQAREQCERDEPG